MRTYKLGLAGVAFAGFLLLASPAYAAGLTETQIQAILTLVSAFGANAATIQNVSAALHGQPSVGVKTSDTQMASAAIDPSSLMVSTSKSTARVTISGTASGASHVRVSLKGYEGGTATVTGGHWSATLRSSLPTGSYAIQVDERDSGAFLTSGTLVVHAAENNGSVSFTAGSSKQITLGTGQMASDGSVQITLTGLGYLNGNQPTAFFRIDGKGFLSSTYSAYAGQGFPENGGISDGTVAAGGISVMVTDVSVESGTATIVVNVVAKG